MDTWLRAAVIFSPKNCIEKSVGAVLTDSYREMIVGDRDAIIYYFLRLVL